ncbi:hypothetical protein ACFLXL_01185 [Chloroflexota bacterium]
MDYLDRLKSHLRLEPAIQDDFLREIRGHIEDSNNELREAGKSSDESSESNAIFLGSPRILAQQIYEVYSQGSWRETLFAVLPHFLTATLFILRLWYNPLWLAIILAGVIGTVIYGWCHGRPTWLFSWLGYLLIPVIIAGIMLLYLPGGWAWLATLVYVPLALCILFLVAKQILRIDWLFVSLMMLPVPIVIGWVMVLSTSNAFLGPFLIQETASWIALSFAVLALAVATFIRVRRRWLKAGALLVCAIMVLVVVALFSHNALSLWAWLFLSILALAHLFVPAILERGIKVRK